MRVLATLVLGAVAAVSIALADEKSDAAARAEWKRETAQKQAKLAADFAPLMEGVVELEVFILDPASGWEGEEKRAKDPSPRLGRWKIVRRVEVTDAREITLLRAGIQRSIETGGPVAACFNPRHGVRFIRNGQAVELILCFECASMDAKGSPEFEGAAISTAAEAAFYRIFRAHGLVPPARLKGRSDAEISKLLVGEWETAEARKEDGGRWTWKFRKTDAADGSDSEAGEATLVWKGAEAGEPSEKQREGRWRIEDGLLLLLLEADPEDPFDMGPVEFAHPLLEVTPDQIAIGSTSVEDSDSKMVLRRK